MSNQRYTTGEFSNGDYGQGQRDSLSHQSPEAASNQFSNESAERSVGTDVGTVCQTSNRNFAFDDDDNKKLFVGGLAHDVSKDQIKKHFSQFGEVINVTVKSDLMTKKPRGFGFVSFTTESAVISALNHGTHMLNGKKIDPKRAEARPKPVPIKKIFVGGLSADVPENDIVQYFEQFGKVENVELPYDKVLNKRRAFCFVNFESEKAACDASSQSKQIIPPMTKQCDVKLASPPRTDPYYGFPVNYNVGRGRGQHHGGITSSGNSGVFGYDSYSNYSGFNPQYTGYNTNYTGYANNYGGSGYDYGVYGGYNSGYGAYDATYWNNYNQSNYSGSGYNESQHSTDDFTRDTM